MSSSNRSREEKPINFDSPEAITSELLALSQTVFPDLSKNFYELSQYLSLQANGRTVLPTATVPVEEDSDSIRIYNFFAELSHTESLEETNEEKEYARDVIEIFKSKIRASGLTLEDLDLDDLTDEVRETLNTAFNSACAQSPTVERRAQLNFLTAEDPEELYNTLLLQFPNLFKPSDAVNKAEIIQNFIRIVLRSDLDLRGISSLNELIYQYNNQISEMIEDAVSMQSSRSVKKPYLSILVDIINSNTQLTPTEKFKVINALSAAMENGEAQLQRHIEALPLRVQDFINSLLRELHTYQDTLTVESVAPTVAAPVIDSEETQEEVRVPKKPKIRESVELAQLEKPTSQEHTLQQERWIIEDFFQRMFEEPVASPRSQRATVTSESDSQLTSPPLEDTDNDEEYNRQPDRVRSNSSSASIASLLRDADQASAQVSSVENDRDHQPAPAPARTRDNNTSASIEDLLRDAGLAEAHNQAASVVSERDHKPAPVPEPAGSPPSARMSESEVTSSPPSPVRIQETEPPQNLPPVFKHESERVRDPLPTSTPVAQTSRSEPEVLAKPMPAQAHEFLFEKLRRKYKEEGGKNKKREALINLIELIEKGSLGNPNAKQILNGALIYCANQIRGEYQYMPIDPTVKTILKWKFGSTLYTEIAVELEKNKNTNPQSDLSQFYQFCITNGISGAPSLSKETTQVLNNLGKDIKTHQDNQQLNVSQYKSELQQRRR